MKIQSENIAFDPDELIVCPECRKPNPPNRTACLYCAAKLELPAGREGSVKLSFRPLENWENGFNIVYIPPAEKADVVSIARYLRSEPELMERMLSSKFPFPLARLESEADAGLAVKHLGDLGVTTRIISDIDLKIGKPNIRLRSVEFLGDAVQLTLFNTGERILISREQISLIVYGRIVESRTESVEKRKKAERKVMSETATSSDDQLIDVYSAGSGPGWRITTKGFDFSPLGREKGLFAAENIQTLLDKLTAFAPSAIFIDEYVSQMGVLTSVWDVERRTDFDGLKRTGVWKAGFANVVRTSNVEQFTKYSRLQRILL